MLGRTALHWLAADSASSPFRLGSLETEVRYLGWMYAAGGT